ncbi:unnamed protein product [Prunus armeniaca]
MEIRVVGRKRSHKYSYNLRSDHRPPDKGIKCVPRAKGQNPRSGRWPRFTGVTPPCFTIPNADLTTHLPRSGSTTQIFSASIVLPGLLL